MPGVSKFGFAALRAKSKGTCTGLLLVFIIGVLDADFIINPSDTWYNGYITCQQKNQAMLSWQMWNDGPRDLKTTYPVWLYGFEVRIHNKSKPFSDRIFILDQLESTKTASRRCVRGTLLQEDFSQFTFEQAHTICQNHTSGSQMLSVTVYNLDKFIISPDIINILFWIKGVEVGTFLNFIAEDLILHCFVLNQHGELRKDNCTNHYLSVCVNATVHDTVQYAGNASKVPNYDRKSPSTPVTSSAGTSEFMTSLFTSETNGGVDLTTSAANKSSDPTNVTSEPKSHSKGKPVMEEKILIALICVGVAVVTTFVVAVIICCRKKWKPNKDRRPTLSDGYSETADSVNFKDAQHYEVSDISEYATPSDAVAGGPRSARPRSSIVEGEYDTISNSKATNTSKRQVAVVKAYSHVAIVPANQRRVSDSNMENTYDVTTLNKQTTGSISHQDGTGNVYGHLGVT